MIDSGKLRAAALVVARRIPAGMHWKLTDTHIQRVRESLGWVKRGCRGRLIPLWQRFPGVPGVLWPLTSGGPSTILQGSGRFGPFRLRLGTLLGVPRPAPAPSSSGLGHRLFTPATGVRVPLGSVEQCPSPACRCFLSSASGHIRRRPIDHPRRTDPARHPFTPRKLRRFSRRCQCQMFRLAPLIPPPTGGGGWIATGRVEQGAALRSAARGSPIPPKKTTAPAGAEEPIARPQSCSIRLALWSASADRRVLPSSDGGGRNLHHSLSSLLPLLREPAGSQLPEKKGRETRLPSAEAEGTVCPAEAGRGSHPRTVRTLGMIVPDTCHLHS